MTYSGVVLKIPDEKYDRLIKQMMLDLNFSECEITPLPKGHNRLIEDKIDAYLDLEYDGHIISNEADFYKYIPTIIEADKESEVEK